ncbi:MAG: hypothetical protein ACW96S_00230 [Promethearchaeota archaeon]|jgi:hypothetical protein
MPEIFEKVKRDVWRVRGERRAGLSLKLAEWGMRNGGFIGGMFIYPGTNIYMNKTVLKKLIDQQPYEIVWAYIYHILLHEYVHSLDHLGEQECRYITLEITEKVFEEKNHPAVILARNGIGTFFPKMQYASPSLSPGEFPFENIQKFDKESYEHYS